ncbi:MAG: hypothetical protein DMG09_23205 [Acidobacteria bacterium]|nr:MAG: hypothetical protein DMG09_23205 [Acidobacteriota bacterium]
MSSAGGVCCRILRCGQQLAPWFPQSREDITTGIQGIKKESKNSSNRSFLGFLAFFDSYG